MNHLNPALVYTGTQNINRIYRTIATKNLATNNNTMVDVPPTRLVLCVCVARACDWPIRFYFFFKLVLWSCIHLYVMYTLLSAAGHRIVADVPRFAISPNSSGISSKTRPPTAVVVELKINFLKISQNIHVVVVRKFGCEKRDFWKIDKKKIDKKKKHSCYSCSGPELENKRSRKKWKKMYFV